MADRISIPDTKTQVMLYDAWEHAGPKLPDYRRGVAGLERAWKDPNTVWYKGPGRSFLYFQDLAPGHMATFHVLNLDGRSVFDPPYWRKMLREIMDEWGLQRLNAYILAPVSVVSRAAQELGFKYEGRMRRMELYNNELVDLDILGLLREELGQDTPKKKRRRRRGRRKKKKEE